MATENPSLKKRIPRWPFIVLGVLLIIGTGAWYAYNRYFAGDKWKPLLQAKLKEMILKSTDSLYHIEYSDFDLNIASGNATLSDFKLIPDTDVYNKLVEQKKAPDNLFILGVDKLTIENSALHGTAAAIAPMANQCRDLVKDIDLVYKLAVRLTDQCEKEFSAKESEHYNNRDINRLKKALEDARKEAVEQLRLVRYFYKQVHWLQERFPDAVLRDVPGLVKLVDREEI